MSDCEAIIAGFFHLQCKIVSVSFESNDGDSNILIASHLSDCYESQLINTEIWQQANNVVYLLHSYAVDHLTPRRNNHNAINKNHWIGLKVTGFKSL